MSGDPAGGRARLLKMLRKYGPEVEALRLARPDIPGGTPAAPLPAPQKFPELQELAALKQDVQDGFSGSQLGLLEIKAKLEADLAAVSRSSAGAARGEKAAAGRPPSDAAAVQAGGPSSASSPAAAPQPEEKPAPSTAAPGALPAALGPFAGMKNFFKERRPGPRFAAGALLAAALAAAGLLFFGRDGAVGREKISLPPSSAAGLCLDPAGGRAFYADPRRQLLVTVSLAGRRAENVRAFQSQGLRALAYDGDAFWATDGTQIQRFAPGSAYPSGSGYKAGPGVFSLSWDGRNLWAASAGGRLVRYAAGEKPEPEAVFQLPEGFSPLLSVSGGRIWELEPRSGRLAAYTLAARPQRLAAAEVKELLPAGTAAGLAVYGGEAWVIAADPAELRRLDLASLGLTADGK